MYKEHSIDVLGQEMPVYVFPGVGEGPRPILIVAQHLPVAHTGIINDPFQIDVGERYAQAGFTCVVPFLFHWWPTDADIAKKREEFRDDWTVADLQATVSFAQTLDDIAADRVGILGHCWGGRIAWLAACHEARLRACVLFYGGRVKAQFADGAPAPIGLAGNIQCSVMGVFGNDDQNPSPEDVNDYEAALKNASVEYEFHRYDEAGHGFQDLHNPERYREQQSEDAWTKAFRFLNSELG